MEVVVSEGFAKVCVDVAYQTTAFVFDQKKKKKD